MNMYLNTNLKDYENLRVQTLQIPEEFIQEYNLQQYVTPNGWVFFEIRKGMYGLPQADVLAHAKLKSILKPPRIRSLQEHPGSMDTLNPPHCVRPRG